MTAASTTIKGAIFGAILAMIFSLSTCTGEPAYAGPILDWPPKVGATIEVSTLCDVTGYEALNMSFERDVSMEGILELYRVAIANKACVSLGDYHVTAQIVRVGEPMVMSTGEVVYAVTLAVEGLDETLYTFVVVGIPPQPQGISL